LQPAQTSAGERPRHDAGLMSRLAEAVRREPESNALLIQCLKEAIARDDYRVNAKRVADRMIHFERQLAGRD
jgi:anti-sigma28 factor (negative regulator of flagellin synthesis)